METINTWGETILEALKNTTSNVITIMPNIILAILTLLIGWLITKFLIYIIKKLLKLLKVDAITEKMNAASFFEKTKLNINFTKVIIGFVKFAMFLIFLFIAFDILNLESVSKGIAGLIKYLPKLFSALLLFFVGIYIANFIKGAIQKGGESLNIAGSETIGWVAFYVIAIIITLTSLNQGGIETTIITNNLSIILAAFLLSLVVAFGLGSRNVVEKLLYSFYSKRNLEIGQTIKFGAIQGEIVNINNLCVSIETDTEIIVIPIKEITENTIKIKK